MTCIIGMVHKNKVYMAGDSCVSANGTYRITKKEKIFKNGNYLIGYTTSTRMGDILRTCELPHISGSNLISQIILKVIPVIREVLRSGGYTKIENNVETGGNLLIGIRGELFEIDTDFQVEEYLNGIAAIGSGGDTALASLMALIRHGNNKYIPEILLRALDISGEINIWTKPPYYWYSTDMI